MTDVTHTISKKLVTHTKDQPQYTWW